MSGPPNPLPIVSFPGDERPMRLFWNHSKHQLVAADPPDSSQLFVRQIPPFGLGTVALPACPWIGLNDARIESFVVDLGQRTATPIGDDHELIDLFSPAVTAVVDAVASAVDSAEVTLAGAAFLTVSFTPRPVVAGEPHVDDDAFDPEDGVHLVAVAGSHAGARFCGEPIPVAAVPGLPLHFDDVWHERLRSGDLAHRQADPGQLVVIPQFGQLHAGPDLRNQPGPPRALIVLRAKTLPKTDW